MSLARNTLLAWPRRAGSLYSRRNTSQVSPLHHDYTQYPKEAGFGGPLWRYTTICSLLVVGAYKYAPEPADDVYLTRWIAMYTSPRNLWLELNAKHTALQEVVSETTLLLSDAKKSRVHRYRYPQSFEQISPFLTPVGTDVDTSRFLVKSDRD